MPTTEAVTLESAVSLFSRLLSASTAIRPLRELLAELSTLFGLGGVAARWPLEGSATVLISSQRSPLNPDIFALINGNPQEVRRALSEGQTVPVETTDGRHCLITPLAIPGRESGAVWLEQFTPVQWAEQDHQLVIFLSQLLPRTEILAQQPGAAIDQTRLLQRLQDASIVAGRMAHDFDNILTGILGFTDLTLAMLPHGSQPHQYLTEVSKVGQRGIVFTQQLHQLSRSGQARPQASHLHEVLRGEEARLRQNGRANVQLQLQIPPDLPPIAVESTPLSVVFNHIIDNAAEAIPNQGQITVRANPIQVSAGLAGSFLGKVAPGECVEVQVIDSGTGMTAEIRAKLFVEPFFTTKVRHRGLGLAIVYRILHAHHAGIQINPASPHGTNVRMIFPIAQNR